MTIRERAVLIILQREKDNKIPIGFYKRNDAGYLKNHP
jgi:hypothetical protein